MKDRIAMQIIRGVEPLGWLEDRLRAQGYPGAVAGEQGLEFTDDLPGSGFGDQVGRGLSIDLRNITR